jgi:hypothetical protein
MHKRQTKRSSNLGDISRARADANLTGLVRLSCASHIASDLYPRLSPWVCLGTRETCKVVLELCMSLDRCSQREGRGGGVSGGDCETRYRSEARG